MIMKMKYAVAFLTSIGIVAIAAAVHARQDAYKSQRRSADLAPVETAKVPYYRSDSDPVITTTPTTARYDLYAPRVEWKIAGNPEHNQLAIEESTLSHEANEIRHRLESATSDTQRSEARAKLAENLGKQFDLRQKRHGLEIEALEAQVKKLKELVQKRQESRSEIISRRVDQILREAEGLGW
jgi:hypothetical protein